MQGQIRVFMRSSKSRSRSKSNRNRPSGNIVNRVFDSSGPEGKVRGTPQQIIDKYNQLARDAQLSNDRVAFENFQQHAEHYTRMLGEAMREQEAFRTQQQDRGDRPQHQQGGNQQRRDDGYDGYSGQDADDAMEAGDDMPDRGSDRNQDRGNDRGQDRGQDRGHDRGSDRRSDSVADAEPMSDEPMGDSGLVETPENAEAPRPRRPRRPRSRSGGGTDGGDGPSSPENQEAAE
jgi:hypothetical protein